MKRDIDSSDLFEDDELSLGGSSGKDQFTNGNNIPFKIVLNFSKEEDSEDLNLTTDLFSENQKTSSQEISESIEENEVDFTDDQILKTNNINEKLRLLVLYETVCSDLRKKTFAEVISESKQSKSVKNADIELVEHGLRQFAQFSEKIFEPIKINRFLSIPESKRRFHIGKGDLSELVKKRTLKALTEEKEKQFSFKKGLQGNTSLKATYSKKLQKFEEILIERATLIEEDIISDKIDQRVFEERKESAKVLKESIDEYLAEMQAIHQESIKLIQQEMHYRKLIVDSKNIQRIENRTKVRNGSEDLYHLISAQGLFNILPDLRFQKDIVNKSQFQDLSSSFSKSL